MVIAVLILAAGSVGGCGTTPMPENPDDIAAWMALHGVPGATVAVIRDFEIAHVEVHGVMDRQTGEEVTARTLFQAASLSKSVSAVAAMVMVQAGGVGLDRPVNLYLESWQVPDNSKQVTELVTLRRLLSHTAGTTVHGFRGYRRPEPVPTLTQVLNGLPPANSAPVVVDMVPGSSFRYSGGGYEIVEQLVRDVSGIGYPEFLQQNVLDPMGMTSSTYEQPLPAARLALAASGNYADGTPVPGGHHIYPELAAAGLWTTAEDLARFLIELQRCLRGESNLVLSPGNTELLLTEVERDYALGFDLWTIEGEPYFGHSGANDGFRCRMLAHRTGGFGVVILTNSDNGNLLSDAVVQVIGKREGWPGF